MSLGKRIREIRKKRGFSQKELAKKIKATAPFISQIEKGLRYPSYGLLQKISYELNTSLEYFVGSEIKDFDDPTSKLVASAVRHLDPEHKIKIVEYIHYLTGTKKYYNIPFFDSPVEYAYYILKQHNFNSPPIDPLKIASSLNVEIIFSKDPLDYEGMLNKSGRKPLIILSPEPTFKPRIKFTVAMLLGHLVIPWHLRNVFYREKESTSLEVTDPLSIEAREFAGALMIPSSVLKKDLKTIEPSLQNFEKLAYEKYGCSMLMIAQRYVQLNNKRSILITSDKKQFTRIYETGFPFTLVDEVKKETFAHSFITNPPKEKEIRKGIVDSTAWFKNPPEKTKVSEESLLDPLFGTTVTLLLLTKEKQQQT